MHTRFIRPQPASSLALAALLAAAACADPSTAPTVREPTEVPAAGVSALATLTVYTDSATWQAAADAAAADAVQFVAFAGLGPGRVTQLDTDYSQFRIVVDQIDAGGFGNPGVYPFLNQSCPTPANANCRLLINLVDPDPAFASTGGPRRVDVVFPQPIIAFGGRFAQLGATAPGGTSTGTVTLEFAGTTLVLNDHLDAAGYGWLGFVASEAGSTMGFTFVKDPLPATIRNDLFDIFGPAYAFAPASATPEEQLADVQAALAALNLPRGITMSLNSKLRAALGALAIGDDAVACAALQDFLEHLTSQTGKKVPVADAAALAGAVAAIRADIGC